MKPDLKLINETENKTICETDEERRERLMRPIGATDVALVKQA